MKRLDWSLEISRIMIYQHLRRLMITAQDLTMQGTQQHQQQQQMVFKFIESKLLPIPTLPPTLQNT